MANAATRTKQTGTAAPGQYLSLVTLVRSWPSLGVTESRPLLGLRTVSGKLVARSQDLGALRELARRERPDYQLNANRDRAP